MCKQAIMCVKVLIHFYIYYIYLYIYLYVSVFSSLSLIFFFFAELRHTNLYLLNLILLWLLLFLLFFTLKAWFDRLKMTDKRMDEQTNWTTESAREREREKSAHTHKISSYSSLSCSLSVYELRSKFFFLSFYSFTFFHNTHVFFLFLTQKSMGMLQLLHKMNWDIFFSCFYFSFLLFFLLCSLGKFLSRSRTE